jgi:hypothetical protein
MFYYDPVQLEMVLGNFDKALELIQRARAKTGDSAQIRLGEIVIHWLKGEREATTRFLRANIGDHDWYPAALAAIENRYPEAHQLADAIDAQSDWPNMMLLMIFNETGDRERSRALVQRIDALPAGSVVLARLITNPATSLPFDLNDAPNFSARLKQAGFDMKNFKPLPRLSQQE